MQSKSVTDVMSRTLHIQYLEHNTFNCFETYTKQAYNEKKANIHASL